MLRNEKHKYTNDYVLGVYHDPMFYKSASFEPHAYLIRMHNICIFPLEPSLMVFLFLEWTFASPCSESLCDLMIRILWIYIKRFSNDWAWWVPGWDCLGFILIVSSSGVSPGDGFSNGVISTPLLLRQQRGRYRSRTCELNQNFKIHHVPCKMEEKQKKLFIIVLIWFWLNHKYDLCLRPFSWHCSSLFQQRKWICYKYDSLF